MKTFTGKPLPESLPGRNMQLSRAQKLVEDAEYIGWPALADSWRKTVADLLAKALATKEK